MINGSFLETYRRVVGRVRVEDDSDCWHAAWFVNFSIIYSVRFGENFALGSGRISFSRELPRHDEGTGRGTVRKSLVVNFDEARRGYTDLERH